MLDADPKAIHQIKFTGSLLPDGNRAIIFNIQEAKGTILDFSQRILYSFCFSIISI